jgi:hypothetical protein
MAGLDSLVIDPEEYRKKLALGLAQSGLDSSPIRSPWQGAARMAQALLGGMALNNLQGNSDEALNAQRVGAGLDPNPTPPSLGQRLGSFLGMGGQADAAQPQAQQLAAALSPSTAPSPALPNATDPRGFRNNNPGNLEASPWTQQQQGFAGTEPQGRFAKFQDMNSGVAAADRLLANYKNQGVDTIGGIISKWAPGGDGNNVSAYAETVAKNAGIPADQKIDLSDPAIRQRILPAMIQYENGKPLPQQGQQLAMNVQPGQQMPMGGQPMPQPPGQQMAQAQPQQGQQMPSRAQPQLPPEIKQQLEYLLRPGATISDRAKAQQIFQQYGTPREQYVPVMDGSGQLLGQRNTLTGEVKPTPEAPEANRIANEMLANPQKYGFKDRNDPNLQNAVTARLSGMQNALPRSPEEEGRVKFATDTATADAKRFSDMSAAADHANVMRGNINALKVLGEDANTGALAPFRSKLQAIAEQFGIDTSQFGNLGDTQAVQGLVGKMAFSMRPAGVQIRTNFEVNQLLAQVPGLATSPQGRSILSDTLDKFAQRTIQEAEIADKALTGEVSRADARKQLRELGPALSVDDMKEIKEAAKAVPQSGGPAKPATTPQDQRQPLGGTTKNGLNWSVQ